MKIKYYIYILFASYIASFFRFFIDNSILVSFFGSFFFGFVIARKLSNFKKRIFLSGFCSCFTSFTGFIHVLHKLINQGEFIKLFFYLNIIVIINLVSMYCGFLISRKIT